MAFLAKDQSNVTERHKKTVDIFQELFGELHQFSGHMSRRGYAIKQALTQCSPSFHPLWQLRWDMEVSEKEKMNSSMSFWIVQTLWWQGELKTISGVWGNEHQEKQFPWSCEANSTCCQNQATGSKESWWEGWDGGERGRQSHLTVFCSFPINGNPCAKSETRNFSPTICLGYWAQGWSSY